MFIFDVTFKDGSGFRGTTAHYLEFEEDKIYFYRTEADYRKYGPYNHDKMSLISNVDKYFVISL